MVDNAQQTAPKSTQAPARVQDDKPIPIARLQMTDVDAALTDCEKVIKTHSDTVKAKLAANAAIPANVLRELSRANAAKAKLILRRIVLLIESGDSAALDLIEKLVKMKAPKSA